MTSFGPVELLVIGFPGSRFTGEIAPALQALVDAGTIRVIDMLLIHKLADGSFEAFEADDIDPEAGAVLKGLLDDAAVALLSEEDVEDLADALDPGSSVGAILVEHTWATGFARALRHADAELLLSMHIPGGAVDEVAALRAAG